VKFHTDYLVIETPKRYEIRDITDDVARIVATANIAEGVVLVSAMHITATLRQAQGDRFKKNLTG